MNRLLKPIPALMALSMACANAPAFAQSLSPLVPADGAAASTWRFVGFPKSKADIPTTRFELAEVQGERALKVSTRASYGTWVHDLPKVNPSRLQWRWRLDQPLTGGQVVADIQTKAGDDAALKVCVMFDHPLDRVPFGQRTLLRSAQTAWLQYRTAACDFEASGVRGGSAEPMVRMQCQSRMTRTRTAELRRHLACPEGDLSCVRPAPK